MNFLVTLNITRKISGGMMLSGIIGLFVGAVALSMGFKLFQTWLDKEVQVEPETMVPDPSLVDKSDEKK